MDKGINTIEPTATETVSMGELVAYGGFGEVRCCTLDGIPGVSKTLHDRSSVEQQKFNEECRIVKMLHHDNVVSCRKVNLAANGNAMELIMEHGGDTVLTHLERKTFPLDRYEDVCLQLINGIAYLHSMKVYHRDLKLENLVMNADGTVKIIDFGLAVQLKDNDEKLYSCCGTKGYLAPEVLDRSHYYGDDVDAWSTGVCCFTMFFSFFPFRLAHSDDFRYTEVRDFQSKHDTCHGTVRCIVNLYEKYRNAPLPSPRMLRTIDGLLGVIPHQRLKVLSVAAVLQSSNGEDA